MHWRPAINSAKERSMPTVRSAALEKDGEKRSKKNIRMFPVLYLPSGVPARKTEKSAENETGHQKSLECAARGNVQGCV
jgi:hypothetical protein